MPRKAAADFTTGTTAVERLRPPPDLAAGSPERALFVDIVASCEVGHFRESDLPVLCIFVRACVMAETAAGELSAGGCVSRLT